MLKDMYLKFIKDHPIGIIKGVCCYNSGSRADSYITDGYAEEITEEEFISNRDGGARKAKEVITGKVEASLEGGADLKQSSKSGSKNQKSTGKKKNKKRRNK